MSFTQWVYAGIGVSSLLLVLGTVVVRLRTPSARGADARAHEVWETAFLAGGPGRVVDAAVAGMHEDGLLTVGGPGVVTVRRATARDAVEAAVLGAVLRTPGGALATVRGEAMRSPAVQGIGDRLAARGLLRRPRLARGWRRWASAQMTVCGVLFFLGVLLAIVGAGGDDGPVVFTIAPVLFGGLVVGALCRTVFRQRITKAGSRALRAARTADSQGGAGGSQGGAGGSWQPAALVVALGGTALIVDELLRQQLEEAQRATAAAAQGGGSSSSGGSSYDSGGGSGSEGTTWCGASDGGSGGGSGGGSSCGAGASCGGGSSGGGSSCGGGSGCGGGGGCGGG
ncbi:TIGR04222 domain-containing membrane protein [Streptomyces sp. NPDC002446]